MVMGREGKFWADTGPANASVANRAAKNILRMSFLQLAISNPHGEERGSAARLEP
jgi:hypothetical protein